MKDWAIHYNKYCSYLLHKKTAFTPLLGKKKTNQLFLQAWPWNSRERVWKESQPGKPQLCVLNQTWSAISPWDKLSLCHLWIKDRTEKDGVISTWIIREYNRKTKTRASIFQKYWKKVNGIEANWRECSESEIPQLFRVIQMCSLFSLFRKKAARSPDLSSHVLCFSFSLFL